MEAAQATRLVWGVQIRMTDVERVRALIAEHKLSGVEVFTTGREASRFAVVASWCMLLAHGFTRDPLQLAQIAPEYGPTDNAEESRTLEAMCEEFQRMRPPVFFGDATRGWRLARASAGSTVAVLARADGAS